MIGGLKPFFTFQKGGMIIRKGVDEPVKTDSLHDAVAVPPEFISNQMIRYEIPDHDFRMVAGEVHMGKVIHHFIRLLDGSF
jgi:hypothetical protein